METPTERHRELTAADIMTAYPRTIGPETLLAEAVSLMIQHSVRHLPVLDAASKLVGVLSDRDVRTAVGDPHRYVEQQAGESTGLRVEPFMTKAIMTVAFDQPVAALARAFAGSEYGAFPVVDGFGAVVGIVSYIDLMRQW